MIIVVLDAFISHRCVSKMILSGVVIKFWPPLTLKLSLLCERQRLKKNENANPLVEIPPTMPLKPKPPPDARRVEERTLMMCSGEIRLPNGPKVLSRC